MSALPAAWEEGVSDQSSPSKTCPYANSEIEDYLRSNHSRWVLSEPEMSFEAKGPIAFRRESGRNLWLCSATDDLEREWFVVIGSGQSPFNADERLWRWMHAETNDLRQTPEAFLEDASSELLLNALPVTR